MDARESKETRWDRVCAEFEDVFGEPQNHPERDIEHHIVLENENLPPPKPRQYRMSAAELEEVKTQLE